MTAQQYSDEFLNALADSLRDPQKSWGGLSEREKTESARAMNQPPPEIPDERDAYAQAVFEWLCETARVDVIASLVACDRYIEVVRSRLPPPDFGSAAPFWNDARDEADMWAQFASDGQIAAMLTACMDRIGGTKVAQRDREALLVAVYNSLPPDRQKAFREKVAGQ